VLGLHHEPTPARAAEVLSVVDEYTRECVALEVRRSFPASGVVAVVEGLARARGCRATSAATTAGVHRGGDPDWLAGAGVGTLYVEPGRRGRRDAESFHSRLRTSSWGPRCSQPVGGAGAGASGVGRTTRSDRTAPWGTRRRGVRSGCPRFDARKAVAEPRTRVVAVKPTLTPPGTQNGAGQMLAGSTKGPRFEGVPRPARHPGPQSGDTHGHRAPPPRVGHRVSPLPTARCVPYCRDPRVVTGTA